MRLTLTRGAVAVLLAALGLAAIVALTLAGHAGASAPASSTTTGAIVPAVSDFKQVSHDETPPTQAQCAIANRRCFNPHSTRAAYNLGGLIADGNGISRGFLTGCL